MKRSAGILKRGAALLLTLLLAAGCASSAPAQGSQSAQAASSAPEKVEFELIQEAETKEAQGAESAEAPSEAAAEEAEEVFEEPEEEAIAEDGVYTTKEDVALYLYTYHKLPSNFMTKKEAQALGWQGGSLEDYAPGMCIGGDYFGNYEKVLPKGKYHECDIGTLGKKKRGAKRIIYSSDWDIYYTDDHYETFELLYEGDGK